MGISVVGANHRTAPIEIRERLHVSDRARGETTEALLGAGGVEECLVLSTCNRTEVYLCTRGSREGELAAERVLAGHADLTHEEAAPYLYRRRDREAVMHLYAVVSGLDSLVVGEAEIQGQVREAYRAGRDGDSGAVGPILHRLFQSALSVGGTVRSGTAVGEGPASIPSAAVQLVSKIFGRLEDRRALVIGAGAMGELTLSVLRDKGVSGTLVASRTLERARETAERVGAEPVEYERFWSALPELDILVTSTSAPHPLVTVDRMRALRGQLREVLVIVDISLPRDVEPAVGSLPGIFLYNIDDLQEVVRGTQESRAGERERAEDLLTASVEDFWDWYRAREAAPLIRSVRERAERIRREEFHDVLEGLDSLSEEDREEIHRASRLVLKKVLHTPTVGLRELASEEEAELMLEVARRLFGLGEGRPRSDHGGEERERSAAVDPESAEGEPEGTASDVGHGRRRA